MHNFNLKSTLLILMTFMLAIAASHTLYAGTHIGGTYSNIAGSTGWGVTADTSQQVGAVEVNLDGTAQGGGTITWGRWHAEAIAPVGPLGIKVFVDGVFKKYEGQETGQHRDIGAAIQLPEIIDGLDLGVGVFGRNSNPFGAPNALDDLEGIGYNRNDFDGLGLENISPPPKGLSIPSPGNSINILVYGSYTINEDWSLKVRAMPQLSGEEKVHQLIVSPQVSFDVNDRINLVLGGDFGFQTYQDTIEQEAALLATVSLEL